MQWIKDIVAGLIETYDTRNVYELLDYYEVTILPKKFVNPDVKARLYLDPFDEYYIYIDEDLDEYTKKFILCHELGHIVLHDLSCEFYHISRVNKDKLEFQADFFASLLLLDINNFETCYLEDMSIDQLSSYFEIPKELLQYTLEKVI